MKEHKPASAVSWFTRWFDIGWRRQEQVERARAKPPEERNFIDRGALAREAANPFSAASSPAVRANFAAQLDAIRYAPALTWNTVEEARNCLAEIRLKQQELRMLKSDIKLHMQQIRQHYTFKRANMPSRLLVRHKATFRANDRRYLTQQESKELAPLEQLARECDAAVQQRERTKLTINRWITANKRAGRQ